MKFDPLLAADLKMWMQGTVRLSPDLSQRLEARVALGEFASIDAAVTEAIERLIGREWTKAEFSAAINIGSTDGDDTLEARDGETVFREIEEYTERMRVRLGLQ